MALTQAREGACAGGAALQACSMLVLWPAVGAEGSSPSAETGCTPGERTTGCRDSIGGGESVMYEREI